MKNSKRRIIFSIAFYIVAIGFVLIKVFKEPPIMWFDWFYSSALFLIGFLHMMSGLGYPIERLIGKAYVKLDNNLIIFKAGLYDTEQKVDWSNINSIISKSGILTISKNDKSTTRLMLSKLTYSDIQEIKEVIKKIAESKDIYVNMD